MGTHEVLSHTADVGVLATGETAAEAFLEATFGLLEIIGAGDIGEAAETIHIYLEGAPDLGALLVDWLSEVLFLQDAHDRTITEVHIDALDRSSLKGRVGLRPRARVLEGTPVKAVTYHQLVVEEQDGVWTAQVFFDI